MRRIQSGLYLLEAGGGANVYLLEDSAGLTLVDAGSPGRAEALIAEMADSGFRLEDVHQMILTHAHADHFGGAAALVRRRRMKIYAHPDDILSIQGRRPLPPAPRRDFWNRWARRLRDRWRRPPPVEVVLPLRAGQSLRFLAQWQVLHTGGHTPGSLSLYDPAKAVLLCGDVLTNRGGRLALEAEDGAGDGARHLLGRLAALPCEVLASGHGPVIRSGAARRIAELSARASAH